MKMKDIRLSDHFTCRRLLRFTLPSVLMMIFTSVYIIVDGFFVSNFVGKTPFAAVNFIMPFLIMLGALGFMFGTGGSALIAITLGEGDKARAQRLFSLFVYVTAVCGVVLAALGIALLRPIAAWLGAEGDLLEQCVLYGRIILIALPAYMLQYEFQSFFVAAEKPQLGLAFTVASGLTNIVLDMLFVGVWRGGLAGAAAASVIRQPSCRRSLTIKVSISELTLNTEAPTVMGTARRARFFSSAPMGRQGPVSGSAWARCRSP